MRKALNHLRKSDPVIAEIIDKAGKYSIQYREPVFETLVRSIVYQQLNGKAALTIFTRFQEALRGEVTPEAVLKMRLPKMRSVGLSAQKASYVRDLAHRTRAGEVNFEGLAELSDQEIIDQLTAVKGVGVWTVQMFLIFALRRPNVLPTGDLGVRAAMKKAYGLDELPKPAEMERLAQPWHPYCSVASWYLWRSLDNQGAM